MRSVNQIKSSTIVNLVVVFTKYPRQQMSCQTPFLKALVFSYNSHASHIHTLLIVFLIVRQPTPLRVTSFVKFHGLVIMKIKIKNKTNESNDKAS